MDVGATPTRVLVFLQHKDAAAFAHDEAIAIHIPGPRRALRCVIEGRRQRARCAEPTDAEFAHRCFGAAGDHDVGVVQRDHPRGIADGVGP
uniref:Uncharacterized protein n=1 Tax=Panagrolaimus superbus TaxID=310955 RepID=A0A914Z1E3_9BILA